jgi:HPr kinase/phosphorylase
MRGEPTIHASAVLIGARAILIRGPAGSGKSRLAFDLICTAMRGPLMFARLVADDRVHVRAANGRLLASPPAALAGLIEIRGLGIRRLPYEALAVVTQVVDLDATGSERMPDSDATRTVIAGVSLARLAVARGENPYLLVLATLMSSPLAEADLAPQCGTATIAETACTRCPDGHD